MIIAETDAPGIGRLVVIASHQARQARGIRTERGIRITVPYGLSKAKVKELVAKIVTELSEVEMKPSAIYRLGDEIDAGMVKIKIGEQHLRPGEMVCQVSGCEIRIGVHRDLDIDDDRVRLALSDLICKGAHRVAQRVMIAEAEQIAREVGVSPAGWEIGRGKKTLGTCHANRRITLSPLLVLLPAELRRFVICHELAHLTEMNHSPRFHALCDSYLGGRERELRARLKKHPWCIIR